jgi:hypothetical protein
MALAVGALLPALAKSGFFSGIAMGLGYGAGVNIGYNVASAYTQPEDFYNRFAFFRYMTRYQGYSSSANYR